MRIKYLVGFEHQRSCFNLLHEVLGGEFVTANLDPTLDAPRYGSPRFPHHVLQADGEDVAWFMTDTLPDLHPRLRGRQVLVEHGLSFKNHLGGVRSSIIREHIDLVLTSGKINEDYHRRAGTPAERIWPLGYLWFFEIPRLEVRPNAVLCFSPWYSGGWNTHHAILGIISRLRAPWHGYVSFHPATHPEVAARFREICSRRDNLTLLETEADLLRAIAYCACGIGGLSSVDSALRYLGKPVILAKSPSSRNPLHWLSWRRQRRQIDHPAFDATLAESIAVSHWLQFREALITRARHAPVNDQIFYPSNFDRAETMREIARLGEYLAATPLLRPRLG